VTAWSEFFRGDSKDEARSDLSGQPDCGTFKFVQIWHYNNGDWKVTREVSYGH